MRVRLGTPFQAGVVQPQNTAFPKLRRRWTRSTRSIFRECSSPAERPFDMREAERAALSIAVEPALRQVSYARCVQGSTGDCDQPSLFELRLGRPFCLLAAACRLPLYESRAGAAPAGGSFQCRVGSAECRILHFAFFILHFEGSCNSITRVQPSEG